MKPLQNNGQKTTDKENKMANSRSSAGINKSGGNNVNPVYKAINTLTSYVGNVGREIRDIPTALGTGSAGETKLQIKEAAAAITANQRGRSTQHTTATGKFVPGTKVRGSNKNK
jgi:hypothetical protein